MSDEKKGYCGFGRYEKFDPKEPMYEYIPGANNVHLEMDPNQNYSLPLGNSENIIGLSPNLPSTLYISEANVAIHSNGHVDYDESNVDESARKFWEAVKKYVMPNE